MEPHAILPMPEYCKIVDEAKSLRAENERLRGIVEKPDEAMTTGVRRYLFSVALVFRKSHPAYRLIDADGLANELERQAAKVGNIIWKDVVQGAIP